MAEMYHIRLTDSDGEGHPYPHLVRSKSVSESMLCLPRFPWLHPEPSIICSKKHLATVNTSLSLDTTVVSATSIMMCRYWHGSYHSWWSKRLSSYSIYFVLWKVWIFLLFLDLREVPLSRMWYFASLVTIRRVPRNITWKFKRLETVKWTLTSDRRWEGDT